MQKQDLNFKNFIHNDDYSPISAFFFTCVFTYSSFAIGLFVTKATKPYIYK